MAIDQEKQTAQTAQIVAAYVAHNSVSVADLPNLIHMVFATLGSLGTGPVQPALAKPKPAVSIKQSVKPDYIICLEDGKKLKMLRRYLKTTYNLTPEQYKDRWNLPADYPMVAPNYARTRSKLAKDIGLGSSRKGKKNSVKSTG